METSHTMQHFLQHNMDPNGFRNLGANGFNGFGGHPHFGDVAIATGNCLPGAFQTLATPAGGSHPWQLQPQQPQQQQQQQPEQVMNGRCAGFGGAVPKFGQISAHSRQPQFGAPWAAATGCGQRKRSLDDDDDVCVPDGDWCVTKRQRPSLGDVDTQVTMCNMDDSAAACANSYPSFQNGHHQMALPSAGTMQCDSVPNSMNTSAVEHAASRGYDAMYAYNLMLSEVYGC